MLKVNNIIGFGASDGPPITIEGTLIGGVSTTGGTTHSVGNIDVGASNAGKRAIVLATVSRGGTYTIDDVTVGGVSLAQQVQIVTTTGDDLRSEIWAGAIGSLSGSQAVEIVTNISTDSAGASGVAVHNMQSDTPIDSATDEVDGTVATLAALEGPGGGIVVGVAAHEADGVSASWSSMSERADVPSGGGASDHRHTAAWDLGPRASANEVITWSGSDPNSAAAASFR